MIEKLIDNAIAYTEKKLKEGLLVWNEIPELSDDEMAEWWNTPEGDRETLYSIASLYSQFPPKRMSVDVCRDILEDVLCKKYPRYCD